ncbi:MAG: hypothetical protein RDV41_06680 [Planctomycetota bacterium]|nr:hypothetical protein [Planctomycetota bacterium]
MRTLAGSLLMVSLVALFAGAAYTQTTADIVGTWVATVKDKKIEMALNADGAMVFAGHKGTYSVEPGQLNVTLGGQPGKYGLKVAGDKLWLTGADLGGTLEFNRQGSRPPAEQPAKVDPTPAPQIKGIDIYTSKQDKSVKIGYPRGWTVSEHQLGITVAEKPGAADTAGLDVLLLAVQENVKTNEDLAKAVIENLRQSSYPDIKVAQQQAHPQAPGLLVVEAAFTAGGVPYLAHAWCAANPQQKMGLFATFYAPKNRYAAFNAEGLLAACVVPMFGGDKAAATPAAGAGMKTGTVSSNRQILFLRQIKEGLEICKLDPSTGNVTVDEKVTSTKMSHPAMSLDGKTTVLAASRMCHLFGQQAGGKGFTIQVRDPKNEAYVEHPSVSRDGKLVATRLKSYQYCGRMDVVNWSGSYEYSRSAIGTWFTVVAFNTETQKAHAIYYNDPELPNVMIDERALGPVFSPTEDILVYADERGKISVCDAITGKQARELKSELTILDYSGLAFSPDGAQLAFFGSTSVAGQDVFGGTAYTIVTTDIRTGAQKQHAIPGAIRPYAPSETRAIVCLDFSPDGRYVVFSGTLRDAGESWAVAQYRELAGMELLPVDIFVLDLQTGSAHRLTQDGKSFDPVWKGR